VPPSIEPSLQPCRRDNRQILFGYSACDRSRWLIDRIPLVAASPVELRLACSFFRRSIFGLADDVPPVSAAAITTAQPATKLRLLLNLASSCHARDEFPTSFESPIPQLAPRGRISDFYRTFSSSCWAGNVLSNALLGYQLKETVGLLDLWMQVDNLTKLWILCLYHRIPKKHVT
jgi:hypothetical protein